MWKCPGCESHEVADASYILASAAATHFVRPWVDEDRYAKLLVCIRELWGQDSAQLVTCGSCGLRTADPFVGGNSEFYITAYGSSSFHPYPVRRWEFELTRSVVPDSGTVLEIGAGSGAFQQSLINSGVTPSRLFATEYSPEGLQALRSLGVDAVDTDLRDLPPADHALVCAHQVFEHLDDLDAVFRAFNSLTNPRGLIALSVPNGVNTFHTETAGGQIDMPPNHISTWRRSSFEAVTARHGWKLVDYQEEEMSRVRSAVNLATSKAFRSRQRSRSLTSRFEKLAPTPKVRYALMALSAGVFLPPAYLRAKDGFGGSVWVLMTRA